MSRRFASLQGRYLRTAERITERDRRIVRSVQKFRVLTTDHLTALFFDSVDRARIRLTTLHRLGLLERFRPGPRTPYHYVVGELGAFLLAAQREPPPQQLDWHRDDVLAVAHSQRLAHLLGINGLGVSLLAHARTRPDVSASWWPEGRCKPWCGTKVEPDARCRYQEGGRAIEFFAEYDRGTEPLERIVKQVDKYARLERDRGVSTWVLYVLPSARREQNVRRALAGTDVPVATAVLDAAVPPHEAVWLPLPEDRYRLRLIELAEHSKPPGARAREVASGRHAWRYRGDGTHDPS